MNSFVGEPNNICTESYLVVGANLSLDNESAHNLSKYLQTICITHTPVVASKGDEFILVEKHTENGETISTARSIKGEEIVKEIAGLIDGNENISTTALNHAKELLSK